MDFFEHQERAHKRTGLLVALYIVAVVGVIAAVYLAMAVIFRFGLVGEAPRGLSTAQKLWDPTLLGLVAAGTSLLVGGGSLYKMAALAGGGQKVAELLGGRLIQPSTTDHSERRVLNVVEEMALAAGTSVPPVYILEEEAGINAFAAGHTPGDAVIGVTRGTVQKLSRDELQGVIAHEFSHILNGDMRLNLRLMGVLFGILLIGLTGYFILRISMRRTYRMGSKKKGGNPLPLIGLALYIIGYVGVFFATLIKAAVSRQREYLADASAVQFTRNPEGIAGALKKIGASAAGSRINDPEAEETSHLFFGNALSGFSDLFGLLSTHPPLIDRIKKIDPQFDGNFKAVTFDPSGRDRDSEPARPRSRPGTPGLGIPGMPGMGRALDPLGAVGTVGLLGPAQLEEAAAVRAALPERMVARTQDPYGATALIYALLLERSGPIREKQLGILAREVEPSLAAEARATADEMASVPPDQRLPLTEMAMPALRQMSEPQFRRFARAVQGLVHADEKVSLFEFALHRTLMRNLGLHFGLIPAPKVEATSLAGLSAPLRMVLSVLAHAGDDSEGDDDRAIRSFEAGIRAANLSNAASLELASRDEATLKELAAALDRLAGAAPRIKPALLQACAACIAADGQVTVTEIELMRVVAATLDCPMPPLSTSGDPAAIPLG